jgi:hypothetical protein
LPSSLLHIHTASARNQQQTNGTITTAQENSPRENSKIFNHLPQSNRPLTLRDALHKPFCLPRESPD